jgi:hypothetical protein
VRSDRTARGNPFLRASITGAGTFPSGLVGPLPFLVPRYSAALIVAIITVALEFLTLVWLRGRSFHTGFLRSFAAVRLVGTIIVLISAAPERQDRDKCTGGYKSAESLIDPPKPSTCSSKR